MSETQNLTDKDFISHGLGYWNNENVNPSQWNDFS